VRPFAVRDLSRDFQVRHSRLFRMTKSTEGLPEPLVERSSPNGLTPDNPVNLLLCANALYLQHAGVCLTSILANNPDLFFNVIIVGRATEVLDEEKVRRSLKQFRNYVLLFKNFTPPADRVLPLNPNAHYTLDNWTRLWVEEFFDENTDRVLYLDCDIVVLGSLAPLWRIDLDGALLGAVDIPGSTQGITHLGMQAEDGYFNSGVLVIDLKQWRQSRALEAVFHYVKTYPERMCYTLDQDALNACFHDRTKRLDYIWNVTWSFFQSQIELPLSATEIERVRRHARILHYNSSLKPWSYFCDHPLKGEYEKYLKMTEWRGFLPPDRTVVNGLRKLSSAILPKGVKKALKAVLPQD
jgi:lipopolysaccharide biosynthesis glycosyltransferase